MTPKTYPRIVYEGITELEPGLYRLRAEIKDPTTIDPKTGLLASFEIDRRKRLPSLGEAIKLREELIAEAKAGQKPGKLTFAQYAQSWLKGTIVRLGKQKRRNYGSFLEHHILPKWEDRVLDTITATEIRVWVAELAETEVMGRPWKDKHGVEQAPKPTGKTLQPDSVNSILACFKSILISAAGDHVIPFNPAADVRGVPKRVKQRSEINSLVPRRGTDREAYLRQFLTIAWETEPDYYAELYLGLALGARGAELRPLRWIEDYDESTGILILQRSQRGNSLNDCLKDRGIRDYELDERVRVVLKWHRERQMRLGRPNPLGLMFPPIHESKHGFQAHNVLNAVFERIYKKMNLPFRITPKAMRRTFNSMLGAKGAQLPMIWRMTGHDSPEMTALYTELPLESTREAQRLALGNVIALPTKKNEGG